MYKFSGRFFLLWTGLVAGIIVNVYFIEKMGIGNWPTEVKKKTIFYIIVFIVKSMAGR